MIILADDLGYGDENLNLAGLNEFANPLAKTPCLASLPEQSLVFRRHCAAAPVCSPSRAGQLIGRAPTRCNIDPYINDLRDNIIVGDESSGVNWGGGSFWNKNSVFTSQDFDRLPSNPFCDDMRRLIRSDLGQANQLGDGAPLVWLRTPKCRTDAKVKQAVCEEKRLNSRTANRRSLGHPQGSHRPERVP